MIKEMVQLPMHAAYTETQTGNAVTNDHREHRRCSLAFSCSVHRMSAHLSNPPLDRLVMQEDERLRVEVDGAHWLQAY